MNLFDFDTTIGDSHFNGLRILNYLNDRSNVYSLIGKGYVLINDLFIVAEDVSIRREVIIDSLLRLSLFNLVEYDNLSKINLDNAAYVKITPAGRYYLTELIFKFVYLDSIITDIPISEQSLLRQFRYLINSTELKYRVERVDRFVKYLIDSEINDFKDYPQFSQSSFTNRYFAKEISKSFDEFKVYIEPILIKISE